MAQSDPSVRLTEAIRLANSGQPEQARAQLLELTRQYPAMELAWLWLASVTDDSQERVRLLERVLSINPANEKARNALTRLTGSASVPPQSQPAPALTVPGTTVARPANAMSMTDMILVIVAGLVALTVIAGLAVLLIGRQQAAAIPTPQPTPTASLTATLRYTLTPSITPGGPTLTPIVPNTLPPSWTPAPSETTAPSFTPAPTLTDLPTSTPPPTVPSVTVIPSAVPTVEPTVVVLPTTAPSVPTAPTTEFF